jgi:hypothetical protein
MYLLIDFIFLAAFPLNHIYNYSHAAKKGNGITLTPKEARESGKSFQNYTQNYTLGVPALKYLIPTDVLYDFLPYETSLKVEYCMVAFIVAVALTLGLLVASRSRKKLTTESPERKVVNKAVGLVLCITYYLIFVPITTFSSPFLLCSQTFKVLTQLECYSGEHLTIFCFVVLSLLLHLFLIMYSSFMLTTNYPNEQIPWGHFPSKAPFFKLLARFPIVMVYQLDTSNRSTLIYFNLSFSLLMIFFLYHRLTRAMTFDQKIHAMAIISESILALLFLFAFLTDLIPKLNPLETVFTIFLVLSLLSAGYFVMQL